MKRFYVRLSLVFLVLTSVLTLAIGWQSLRSVDRFVDETEQKLNSGLADVLAVEFQPYLNDAIDTESIQQKIEYFIGINPRIDIYLLGSNGMIKALFVPSGQEPVLAVLDTAPMQQVMAGAELPIWGQDPLSETGMKPFSVAPLEIMGEQGCYLYIVLGSQRYDSAAAMLSDSYIMQALVRGLALVLIVTLLVGLVLFAVLTRRMGRISTVVGSYSSGDYSARIGLRENDELGQLAATIDRMAGTIERNIAELENTDRLRRDLVANISHDLRSPLASIRGYLETIIIKSDELSREDLRSYVETGLANTERLNRLVSELFELSKLDANQVDLNPEEFSLADLVQDVVQQFGPAAMEAGVELKSTYPDEPSLAYGDIGLVERAISNLIDNAIKYTPSGGTVTVEPTWNGDLVEVRVSDTGRGISEEDLPHIFDRFFRAEKSRNLDGGGTGLGLAIAKKIVELHDSTISVTSRLNRGTTFSFLLPASPAGLSPA